MPVKVTIVILTYNHEQYIADALDSVFSQQTDFQFEVLVSNDGSTDHTSEIIKKYETKYTDKLTVLASSENRGIRSSLLDLAALIKGKYLAILDGDDYWKHPFKLQKQIDFLDNNQEFAGSFHDTEIQDTVTSGNQYFESSNSYSQRYPYKKHLYFEDVVSRNVIIPSSSLILRTDFLSTVDPGYLDDNYSTLWKLSVFAIKGSKLNYTNEAWSVYRNHNQGISKGDPLAFHLSHIRFLKKLAKDERYTYYKYAIYQSIVNEYKIILDSKDTDKSKKRTFFRYYLFAEIHKIWHYNKKLNESIKEGNN